MGVVQISSASDDGKVRKAKGRSEQWLAKQLKIQKQKHSTSTSNKTDQDTDKFIFEQAEKNADSAGSDFYHKPVRFNFNHNLLLNHLT
ncbi:MAG: hypothetical protein MHPSP_004574 [Paramarteilia canceri]